MNVVRRPVKSREQGWSKSLAQNLYRMGLKPNFVSVMSSVFAAGAGFCIFKSGQGSFFILLSLVFIQMRLICNLIDGMLAIEHGLKSKVGEIYNDLPDRFSDLFIIVPLGYAIVEKAWALELAWIAGTLAVLTAYVRILGAVAGAPQFFIGPMAKQHRMALINLTMLVALIEYNMSSTIVQSFFWCLIILAFGSLITVVRRLRIIFKALT